MPKSKLNQHAGDHSTNIQGQTVHIHSGLTYADARQIAMDVFTDNFLRVRDQAAKIASERAEHIIDRILHLLEENPHLLAEFLQPSMQYALFTAQKEFAKGGDKDLEDLLVDFIVDRIANPNRNMVQIILDEALVTAPKLSHAHLDTLTVSFLLTQASQDLKTFTEFKAYLTERFLPFIENLTSEPEHYLYLELQRCGQVRLGTYLGFEYGFKATYPGIFQKGFTPETMNERLGDIDNRLDILLIRCFHDPKKLQFDTKDSEILRQKLASLNLDQETETKVMYFFRDTTMSTEEINNVLIGIDHRMEKIVNIWEKSYLNKFHLSYLGTAIAIANYKRKTGEKLDLAAWIEE